MEYVHVYTMSHGVEETLRRWYVSWDGSPIYPNISRELVRVQVSLLF